LTALPRSVTSRVGTVGKQDAGMGFAFTARERFTAAAFAPLACALLLCAAGCTTGDGPGSPESDKPASEQCQDFEDAYCAKAVECAASTDRADFGETCAFSFRVYLPCATVTFVAAGAGTQPCLDALHAIQCSTVQAGSFPSTPAACQRLYGT